MFVFRHRFTRRQLRHLDQSEKVLTVQGDARCLGGLIAVLARRERC